MATSRANLATTKDGETYNKLQRPADYLTSTTPCLPPLPVPVPINHSSASKRKRGKDTGYAGSKRSKAGNGNDWSEEEQGRSVGQVKECGMRTMFPEMDGEGELGEGMEEALAYLRGVRYVVAVSFWGGGSAVLVWSC